MKDLKAINKNLVLCCVIATFSTACAKINFDELPQTTTSITPPSTNKTVSRTEVVAYGNKQVDFLLVLDDSNSMLPELRKLAARMSTFVNSLDASNIDWQMCLTTSRGYVVGGSLTHGVNLPWSNYAPAPGVPSYLLKKGTSNLNTIFTSTIENMAIGGVNSGDERAIKAAYDNFVTAPAHTCYRPGAAISVIAISDEDERSLGGDPTKFKVGRDNPAAYQPLEAADMPANLVAQAKTSFGDDVRFTFSSIIVKPNDTACEILQDIDVSPRHPGFIYAEASRLTDGGMGSICDTDYSANLNTFKDKIVNSLSTLMLECSADPETLQVTIGGLTVSGVKLDGKILKFAHPLIEGTEIGLKFDCLD